MTYTVQELLDLQERFNEEHPLVTGDVEAFQIWLELEESKGKPNE